MHTIERNSSKTKKGKELITCMDGLVLVSLKNAKLLCGYSANTSNSVILDKVTRNSLVKKLYMTTKGVIKETSYLTLASFLQLESAATQSDKKQNIKHAIDLIQEFLIDVSKYIKENQINSNYLGHNPIFETKEPEEVQANSQFMETVCMEADEMIDEIYMLVGPYDQSAKSKARWKKLYDTLDSCLDESIRQSCQRYKRDNGVSISIIQYIKTQTLLLDKLHEIAWDLFREDRA